jgi:hypothetical protein
MTEPRRRGASVSGRDGGEEKAIYLLLSTVYVVS